MKKTWLGVVCAIAWIPLFAQKPPVDFTTAKNWPGVGGEAISNDGNYVYYSIRNYPQGGNTLVIQSTNSDWEKEFINASALNFSDDNKELIFKTGRDTTYSLILGTEDVHYTLDKQPPLSSHSSQNSIPVQTQTKKTDEVKVDVYSYHDNSAKEGETILTKTKDYVLLRSGAAYAGLYESNWNVTDYWSCWLMSVKDSSRKLIRDHITNPHGVPGLSPTGKWLIYYDFKNRNYFSYETATGVVRNITKPVHTFWINKENDQPRQELCWVPWRGTWLAGDEAVLMYDNYDIWEVDPSNNKPPVNLTNGYGQKHQVKFELINEGDGLRSFSVSEKPTLILSAINKINKERGFYSVTLGVKKDPQLCTMGAYVYGNWVDGYAFPPQKAKDANVYLVSRMSATEYPNLFLTRDFKKFTRLTNLHPQQNYNWLTTELIQWKTLDGSMSTGILYKPEDFDPHKKYPVIFQFYEKRSDELNAFIRPGAWWSAINIPWFVSHGYLVFVPDIHYKMGEPVQSAYNSVVSAALYLSKKAWVDKKRIGLQGHSFGAFETNYIITHTNIFAAACSASGVSDLISFYLSDARDTHPLFSVEQGQDRMNATLWQRPDLYIANSPIFKADKVTTPLLMMNNKADNAVPFSQGVEFFTALRRLGKKVWMLQYDEGGHSLNRGGNDATDYSIRTSQFFDHYLKGVPAPVWMTKGIPGRD